jgi:hypothetical protein
MGRAGDLPDLRDRATAAFMLRGIGSRAGMPAGCLLLLAGVAVTFGAIATTTAAAWVMWAATAAGWDR